MKHTRGAIARMAQRIGLDGPARLDDLTATAGVSVAELKRWAIEGKRAGGGPVFLDAVVDKRTGEWWSSWAAVARFKAAVEAAKVSPEPAARR